MARIAGNIFEIMARAGVITKHAIGRDELDGPVGVSSLGYRWVPRTLTPHARPEQCSDPRSGGLMALQIEILGHKTRHASKRREAPHTDCGCLIRHSGGGQN